MLPDPSVWSSEAMERFKSSGLPSRDWPLFRDRFIVSMTRHLADRHHEAVRSTWGSVG